MIINSIIRSAGIVLIAIALAFALGTCGGGNQSSVPPSLKPGRASVSPQASDATGGQLQHRVEPRPGAADSLDDALVELAGMECPEGVDEELWGELKGALKEALVTQMESRLSSRDSIGNNSGLESPDSTIRGTTARLASAPPMLAEDRVNDLTLIDHYDGTYTLEWHYQNLGDYDQNGTVGISDITPIAMHYGEEVPEGDADRNSIQAVVDGSGNDKVDIADITPIAMYYGTCCEHYSLRRAFTHPEDIGETTEIGTAPVELAEGDGRKVFSVDLTQSPYSFLAVAPVDEEESPGELSNVVMTPNHSPVAELSAEPAQGDAPLHVSFDASGSSDVDGAIVKYEWDWEGDGVYDYDSGTDPTAERLYVTADYYDPQVRVTDEHNSQASASVAVQAGNWRISVVMEDVSSGYASHTHLEVVNGHPAVSLYEGQDAFWYVRAEDNMGASWGSPVLVDVDSQEGFNLAGDNELIVANGHPALAYQAGDDWELRYARANDADGTSWGEPIVVGDLLLGEGNLFSATIVNGRPAIAFWDIYLYYVRANDANGDTWGSPIQFDYYPWGGLSLLVVNGKPAIGGLMRYARALDANGDTWGSPVAVSDEGGGWSQMAIVNGNPAIACSDNVPELGGRILKYVRALDADGETWGDPVTVTDDTGVARPSLQVVHGHPSIAYEWHHGDYEHLMYVKATDPDGTNWRSPVIVDETDFAYPSLELVNGCPAISYHALNEIKFAIYY